MRRRVICLCTVCLTCELTAKEFYNKKKHFKGNIMNLSTKMKQLRIAHNITQSQLADKINVSKSTIYAWESAKRPPKIKHIIAIAKIYNITVDYLIGLKD